MRNFRQFFGRRLRMGLGGRALIGLIAVLLLLTLSRGLIGLVNPSATLGEGGRVRVDSSQKSQPSPSWSEQILVAEAESDQLTVHIAGEVKNPGVYRLPAGSRVQDGLVQAGGVLPGADSAAVNLAAKLQDGVRILIPAKGQTQSDSESQTTINLNQASAQQLKELPGIGEVLAKRIVAWRAQHGAFRRVEDLQKVSGVGGKLLTQIRDRVSL